MSRRLPKFTLSKDLHVIIRLVHGKEGRHEIPELPTLISTIEETQTLEETIQVINDNLRLYPIKDEERWREGNPPLIDIHRDAIAVYVTVRRYPGTGERYERLKLGDDGTLSLTDPIWDWETFQDVVDTWDFEAPCVSILSIDVQLDEAVVERWVDAEMQMLLECLERQNLSEDREGDCVVGSV